MLFLDQFSFFLSLSFLIKVLSNFKEVGRITFIFCTQFSLILTAISQRSTHSTELSNQCRSLRGMLCVHALSFASSYQEQLHTPPVITLLLSNYINSTIEIIG